MCLACVLLCTQANHLTKAQMYWLRATLPLAKTRDNTALGYLFAPTSELVRQDKEARPSLKERNRRRELSFYYDCGT